MDEIKMSFPIISDVLEGQQDYCNKLKMIYNLFRSRLFDFCLLQCSSVMSLLECLFLIQKN